MRGRLAGSVPIVLVLLFAAGRDGDAQGRGGPPPNVGRNARAIAPIDLTGTWVSVVTEDWRWRMVTPARGDYASVPITAEGKRVADAWDPAADTAAGEQCKSYGAAGIMRVPTRLRISWLDDETLRVETDAGMQTRLLHFGSQPPADAPPTWQGYSAAEWNVQGRTLKVATNHMRPGYLRKNGVPYSADAVLTEYWDVHREADEWLVVTSVVSDPKFLQQQYITSPNFKKEPDGSKWDPTPCSATW
jgi:hypothetical protein